MTINSCYADISNYNAIKANLESVVSYMNVAGNRFSPVSNLINSVYEIDEMSTPIVGKCNSLHSDIVSTVKFINSTLIPAIDAAIEGRRREISNLEEQARIEEEKRKEAERKALEERARIEAARRSGRG